MTNVDLNSNAVASLQVKDNYFDQNSLNAVKLMGKHNDPQALKEVAKKFEAMFMQQVMKSMRDANEVFSEGGLFDSKEEKFHQDMLDQQLVVNLTSGEGMGLAKALYAQLTKNQKPKEEQILLDESKNTFQVNNPPLTSLGLQIKPVIGLVSKSDMVSGSSKNDSASKQLGSSKKSLSLEPESFIAQIKPYAEKAAKALDVGVDVILAQTALETGWGKYVLHDEQGKNTFNLFNVKGGASWNGGKVSTSTLEVVDGTTVKQKAAFRQYASYEECFDDYVSLIKESSRYSDLANTQTSEDYARKLQKAGYATDPNYAKKIIKVMSSDYIQSVLQSAQFGGSSTSDLNEKNLVHPEHLNPSSFYDGEAS